MYSSKIASFLRVPNGAAAGQISCCPVCADSYQSEEKKCPRILPCGHTFCHSCINELRTYNGIKCPYCSTYHYSIHEACECVKNYALIPASLPTASRPRKSISDFAKSIHMKTISSPSNNSQFEESLLCSYHHKPLNLYDDYCRQFICLDCIDEESHESKYSSFFSKYIPYFHTIYIIYDQIIHFVFLNKQYFVVNIACQIHFKKQKKKYKD
jgi:hypothetical protein